LSPNYISSVQYRGSKHFAEQLTDWTLKSVSDDYTFINFNVLFPHACERLRNRGINLGTPRQYLSYAAPKRFLSSRSSSITTRYITGI